MNSRSMIRQPRSRASASVPSVEPLSATMISAARPATDATQSAIFACSFRQGIMTDSASASIVPPVASAVDKPLLIGNLHRDGIIESEGSLLLALLATSLGAGSHR